MDCTKTHKEIVQYQIEQHKYLHQYFSSILEEQNPELRQNRCDSNSNLYPHDPVVLRLVDHYMHSACCEGDNYICDACETQIKHLKDLSWMKSPRHTVRARLLRSLKKQRSKVDCN